MGSNGTRPRKAVRKEVEALREQLCRLHKYDWVKAQCIFDRMCALTNLSGGPKSSTPFPRSCRGCGMYGHSRGSKRCYLANEPLEIVQWVPITSREQCQSDAQWEHVQECKRLNEEWERMGELGLGCDRVATPFTSASCIPLHCSCAGCLEVKAWRASNRGSS